MFPLNFLITAVTMPAQPPFILRLHNPTGMYPPIKESLAHWAIAKMALADTGCKSGVTASGHVLLAKPISSDGDWTIKDEAPMDVLQRKSALCHENDYRLVDCTQIFENGDPCFHCFITSVDESTAIAARIDGTAIWILVSNYMGLIECNECKTGIDRREWNEIQKGFIDLILDLEWGGMVGKVTPVFPAPVR